MSDGPSYGNIGPRADGPPKGEATGEHRMIRMIAEDVLGLTAIVVVCLVVYHL